MVASTLWSLPPEETNSNQSGLWLFSRIPRCVAERRAIIGSSSHEQPVRSSISLLEGDNSCRVWHRKDVSFLSSWSRAQRLPTFSLVQRQYTWQTDNGVPNECSPLWKWTKPSCCYVWFKKDHSWRRGGVWRKCSRISALVQRLFTQVKWKVMKSLWHPQTRGS